MPKLGTKTYSTFKVEPDAVSYFGPAHTVTQRDLLGLRRTLPKSSGADRGVQKSSSKLTRSVVINAETGAMRDAIVSVETSLPVGITQADADTLLADAQALAASAYAKKVATTGDIHVPDDAV